MSTANRQYPVLHLYPVSPDILAFSTTRKGGVSEGNYGGFNMDIYRSDSKENTVENRRLLAEELGIPVSHIVIPHQTHGVNCVAITADYPDLDEEDRFLLTENTDAVMTDVGNICVGVSTADCIPVLLYDEKHHAAAAIHAGWRGTVQRIVSKVIVDMQKAYHTDPACIKAVVAPGISLEKFEVGQEVYDEFARKGFDMSRISRKYKKWHINLPLCNKLQLMEAGVKEQNIIMSGICTYTCSNEYFSARKLGRDSGRIYTGILLRQEIR